MIADDGEVVKIPVCCNEVGTDTCHWLTLKHPACFAFRIQEKEGFFFFFGDGGMKKRKKGGKERPLFVFLYCTQAVACVRVCRC